MTHTTTISNTKASKETDWPKAEANDLKIGGIAPQHLLKRSAVRKMTT